MLKYMESITVGGRVMNGHGIMLTGFYFEDYFSPDDKTQ